MSRRWLEATAIAALAVGCGIKNGDGVTGVGSGGDPQTGDFPVTGTVDPVQPKPPAACRQTFGAHGQVLATFDVHAVGDVAVDGAGNVLVRTDAAGFVKLSPTGDVLYAYPFGTFLAADATGNAYVAGSFTAPIDLGLGVIKPFGNIDVFVVKLDAAGHVKFAKSLGLCGDGVESIAVALDGRIAISGSVMGTAVLDANGDVLFDLPFAGHVAFDAKGDLVVAGSFTSIDLGDGLVASVGAHDGFVIELDASGKRLFSQIIPSSGAGSSVLPTSVAVDAFGNVALGGNFVGSIDLFGTTLREQLGGESGIVFDTFLVKLDATGKFLAELGGPTTVLNGLAFDASGNLLASGTATGNLPPFRITDLVSLDAGGALRFEDRQIPATGYGAAFGVAADSCGIVYWAVSTRAAFGGVETGMVSHLLKIAP